MGPGPSEAQTVKRKDTEWQCVVRRELRTAEDNDIL